VIIIGKPLIFLLPIFYVLTYSHLTDLQTKTTLLYTLITSMAALWGLINLIYIFILKSFIRWENKDNYSPKSEKLFQLNMIVFNIVIFSAIVVGIFTYAFIEQISDSNIAVTISLSITAIILTFSLVMNMCLARIKTI
jgi:hypothetical protein